MYSVRDGGRASLVLVRPDGTGRRVLAEHEQGDLSPQSWSPDGRHILYTTTLRGITQLWRTDTSGKSVVLDTGPAARIEEVAWSPVADRIAYARKADEQGAIVVAPIARPQEGRAITPICCHEGPDWSPDGKRTVFGSLRGLSIAGVHSKRTDRFALERYSYSSDPDWAPC